MAEKKKRKTLPPRGDPAAKGGVPDRKPLIPPLLQKEDFGENTFAGALEAVKGVLEQASSTAAPVKPRKKG